MTFHVRIRHGSSTVLAEYRCPSCGDFDATVARDKFGDPAPSQACPDCGAESEHIISRITGKVRIAEVHRGKSDPRPPNVLNTEALADGMPYEEWSKQTDKKNWDALRKKRRRDHAL